MTLPSIPLLLLLLAGSAPAAFAQPQRPAPPTSVPQTFPVNPEVCRSDRIRSAWERQLQPWADQSEAVQSQLRRVQAELMAATLQRCVDQGLLSLEVTRQIAADLGLPPAQATAPGSAAGSPPATRP